MTIYANVIWEPQNSILEEFVILGKPPRGHQEGELALEIGAEAVIRAFTILYAGSRFGHGLQTGHHVMVREDNQVGNQVSIGTSSVLEFGNIIGDRVRIHSGCFLERVTLENDVFIGPNVVFTDDPHPICPRYLDCKRGAYIGEHSRIGANSTLLPGIRIGKNCLIGAGSLVHTDIPDNSVAVGNPAKVIKQIQDLKCHTGLFERPYIWLEETGLEPLD